VTRPVVCFFPARNEAATVGAVVRRVPRSVGGHPVVAVVVDDGSTDPTAAIAAGAGARVVTIRPGRGLGAAVRRGFEEAVALDAVAVAFCDADGEYAPEELPTLVAPILAGDADYVVGSRFAWRNPMRPHRRAGNRLLTRLVGALSGVDVTDGQSGYRALSARAARDAEIVHDYNYAQVLTLDLVDKGFRYAERPISYAPRAYGRSFVRLVPYLAHVLPAMWRVRRRTSTTPSLVLDDVRAEPVAGA
jgi:glycosyltransferase involved in cell wall biosynthesis